MRSSWQILEERLTQNNLQARQPSFWQTSGCIVFGGHARHCAVRLDALYMQKLKEASYKLPFASVPLGVNCLPYCAARSGFAVSYRCVAASTVRATRDFRKNESHLEGR